MNMRLIWMVALLTQTCGAVEDRKWLYNEKFPVAGFSLNLYRNPDGELPNSRGPKFVYEFMLQRGDSPEISLAIMRSTNPYAIDAIPFRPMGVCDMIQTAEGKTGILVHGSGTQEYFHLVFNARHPAPTAELSRLDVWEHEMADKDATCKLVTPDRVLAKSSDGKQTHYLQRLSSGAWTFDGRPITSSFGFTKEGQPSWPKTTSKTGDAAAQTTTMPRSESGQVISSTNRKPEGGSSSVSNQGMNETAYLWWYALALLAAAAGTYLVWKHKKNHS